MWGGGGLVNSHSSCSKNPGLFINKQFLPSSVLWPCSKFFLFHAFTIHCTHLSYLTTHMTLVPFFLQHTRWLLPQTFVLNAGNNLADGSITLEGSFLTPLLRDAKHYLDGEASCTVARYHAGVSAHSVPQHAYAKPWCETLPSSTGH